MPRCSQCNEEHDEVEPGFRFPDAYFAVPEAERKERIQASSDLVRIDGLAHFIRAVAPLPVHGRDAPYSWGFWVKVSRQDFEAYERDYSVDAPADHAGFVGTLANQTRWLKPTLGRRVHVHPGKSSQRPRLVLLEDDHELTQLQTNGVTQTQVDEWSDAISARRLPVVRAPKKPSLDDHGWQLVHPEDVSRRTLELPRPLRAGDVVKVPFVLHAADHRGEVCERAELMWVVVDEVGPRGWARGRLDSHPFVPAAIDAGSPVMFHTTHVIALDADEAPAQ